MKILLLGAKGFLGNQVRKKLKKSNFNFIPVSGSTKLDLRDRDQFESLMDDIEPINVIINCAAYTGGIKFGLEYPADVFTNNMLININMFDLARNKKVKRIINPISNCTYPRNARILKEEEWWNGDLDESALSFGTVRKANWVQSWAFKRQYGVNTINLIFPNMFGPGDHFDSIKSHALGSFVHKFIQAKINNENSVTIWGTGTPVREWLYVEDAAEIIVRSVTVNPFIEPVNVGIGEGISIIELAKLIKKIVCYEGNIELDRSRPDGAPHKIMDNSRMLNKYNGWTPPTSLREGLKKTVEWYFKHNIQQES